MPSQRRKDWPGSHPPLPSRASRDRYLARTSEALCHRYLTTLWIPSRQAQNICHSVKACHTVFIWIHVYLACVKKKKVEICRQKYNCLFLRNHNMNFHLFFFLYKYILVDRNVTLTHTCNLNVVERSFTSWHSVKSSVPWIELRNYGNVKIQIKCKIVLHKYRAIIFQTRLGYTTVLQGQTNSLKCLRCNCFVIEKHVHLYPNTCITLHVKLL